MSEPRSAHLTRPSALRLAAAGIQPFIYSWLVVVLLGLLSYTLMAHSPALGETAWQDSASIATGWWLTAFGGSLFFDGSAINLAPLTITLLTWLVARIFIRSVPLDGIRDVAWAILPGAIFTGLLGFLAPDGSSSITAAVGAMLLTGLAMLSSRNRSDWFGEGFFTTPAGRIVYDGAILARTALVALLTVALVSALIIVIIRRDQIAAIQDYYIVDVPSAIFMGAFQIAYLPNFLVWAAAYILGPGFAIGTGTSFAPFDVVSGPLPAIPVLGALPAPGQSSPWVIVLPILVGLGVGLMRSKAFISIREAAFSGLSAMGWLGILMSLLGAVATGAIGPERMRVVGVAPPLLAGTSIVLVGVFVLLGLLAGNQEVRDKLRQRKQADHDDDGDARITHRETLVPASAAASAEQHPAPVSHSPEVRTPDDGIDDDPELDKRIEMLHEEPPESEERP